MSLPALMQWYRADPVAADVLLDYLDEGGKVLCLKHSTLWLADERAYEILGTTMAAQRSLMKTLEGPQWMVGVNWSWTPCNARREIARSLSGIDAQVTIYLRTGRAHT